MSLQPHSSKEPDVMWNVSSHAYLSSAYLFLVGCLLKSLAHFYSSLYILDNYSDRSFATIFFQLVICPCGLLVMIITEEKILILIKSKISLRFCKDPTFVVVSKKSLQIPDI
jgi:hypothetical protein